jgi:hypothetical protein
MVCATACGGARNKGTDGGVTSLNGPCTLTVDQTTTVTVDGWCVTRPKVVAADSEAVYVLDALHGTLLRIDPATGNATALNVPGSDPSVTEPLFDAGDELLFRGCYGQFNCAIYSVLRSGASLHKVADLQPRYSTDFVRVKALTADATSAYWLDSGLWSAPRAGGASPRLLLDGLIQYVGGLATDSAALYITIPENSVQRIPLDGSTPTVLSNQLMPHSLLVHNGALYWVDGGTQQVDCTPTDGSIEMWSGSGAPTVLAAPLVGPGNFVIVGDRLAWTEDGGWCNLPAAVGRVVVRLPSGDLVTVADGQLEPGSIVTDGTTLFWAVSSAWDDRGAVVHAPLP